MAETPHDHAAKRASERRSRFYNKVGHEVVGITYKAAFASIPGATATLLDGGKSGLLVGATSFGVTLGPEMLKKVFEHFGEGVTKRAQRAFEEDELGRLDKLISERHECLDEREPTIEFEIKGTDTPLDGKSYAMPTCLLESFKDEFHDEAEKTFLQSLPEDRRLQYLQAKTLQRPMLEQHRSSMSKADAFRVFHAYERRIDIEISSLISKRLNQMALREADMALLDLEVAGIDPGHWDEVPSWWEEAGLSGTVRPLLSEVSPSLESGDSLEPSLENELAPDVLPELLEATRLRSQAEKSITFE
jgi:hypothetical protein